MDVTPLIRADAKIIQSYKGGVFKISNAVYEHSVIVMPERVLEWSIDLQNIRVEDFAVLAPYRDQVEVLLFGTGEKQIFLSPTLRRDIQKQHGFIVESMDNGAAARTYNVLMAEGRLVAAALT